MSTSSLPEDSTPSQSTKSHARRTTTIDRSVGARIKERRVALDMTQQQLAKAIGVTSQQVQKYEHGLDRIFVSRLYEIGWVLGVTVSWFYEDLNQNGLTGAGTATKHPNHEPALERYLDSIKNNVQRRALLHLMKLLADEPVQHEGG